MLSFWSYYVYVYNNIVIAMNITFEINMFKPIDTGSQDEKYANHNKVWTFDTYQII